MSKENKKILLDKLGPFDQIREMNGLVWDLNDDLNYLMSFDTEDEEENAEAMKVYATVVNEVAAIRSIVDQLAIMLDADEILEEVVDGIEETMIQELDEEATPTLIN